MLEHEILAEKDLHWKGHTKERGPTIKSWGCGIETKNINPGHTSATFLLLRSFTSSAINLNYRVILCWIAASGFSSKTIRQSEDHSSLPCFPFCIHILHRTAFSLESHCFQCLQDITGEKTLCWAAARTVSMPDTWKDLFCLSNSLICSFSSLMDLVYKPYKFLPPLSVSSSMLSIFSSHLLRLTCACILWMQSREPENIPEYQDTVIRPIHKLLACSLVYTQPVPAYQLEVPQRILRHCWELETPRTHTFPQDSICLQLSCFEGVTSSGLTLCARWTVTLLAWINIST